MKRLAGLAAFAAALAVCQPAPAQENAKFKRDCADWLAKKGYSVDYIEQRTGERPTGTLAASWRSNLEPEDAQPGDVIFLSVESSDGKGERAEVVDRVIRNDDGSIRAFRTSSMNNGKAVVPQCHVTDHFGVVVQRTVRFDRVLRAWRPDKK